MSSEVAAQQHDALCAETLAGLESYWDRVPFFAEKRRRYELEREYWLKAVERGYVPPPEGDWVTGDMRSGAWEKRRRESMQNLLHDRARLSRLKREVYSFPPREKSGITIELRGASAWVETAFERRATLERVQSQRAPIVHVPERLENTARPRERRGSRRRSSSSSRGSPSSDLPEPPLAVIPPAEFRRQLRGALGDAP